MNFTVKILFRKEEIEKIYNNIPLDLEEENIHLKTYNFNTKQELDSFLKGIDCAIGWMEYCIIEKHIQLKS